MLSCWFCLRCWIHIVYFCCSIRFSLFYGYICCRVIDCFFCCIGFFLGFCLSRSFLFICQICTSINLVILSFKSFIDCLLSWWFCLRSWIYIVYFCCSISLSLFYTCVCCCIIDCFFRCIGFFLGFCLSRSFLFICQICTSINLVILSFKSFIDCLLSWWFCLRSWIYIVYFCCSISLSLFYTCVCCCIIDCFFRCIGFFLGFCLSHSFLFICQICTSIDRIVFIFQCFVNCLLSRRFCLCRWIYIVYFCCSVSLSLFYSCVCCRVIDCIFRCIGFFLSLCLSCSFFFVR